MSIGFLLAVYLITHHMGNKLDKQIKDMATDFVEKNQTFDVSDMKSSALYSIVYRALPHVVILALILNGLQDLGFFSAIGIVYLSLQIIKNTIHLFVLTTIPAQDFAVKVIEGFKEAS
jgi:hypothetical protein